MPPRASRRSTAARDSCFRGPEYLSVYAGDTGREIAKVDWIERGRSEDWADHTGNRSSRHMLGVAYLDGKTPSVLVVRGTYGLMKVDAWTLRGGALQKIWRWTNERQPFKYQGQGQHSIKVGDIDGDGFDEILNGSIAIDNDGRTMWGTGMGHGDRFYLSDIDPDRVPASKSGTRSRIPIRRTASASGTRRAGTLLFGTKRAEPRQPDRRRPRRRHRSRRSRAWRCGATSSSSRRQARSFPGRCRRRTSSSGGTADLLRELHSRGAISKWKGAELGRTEGSRPSGGRPLRRLARGDRDVRERASCGSTRPRFGPSDRRVTLMQDPLYRNDVTHRSMGYPHVPMTSYLPRDASRPGAGRGRAGKRLAWLRLGRHIIYDPLTSAGSAANTLARTSYPCPDAPTAPRRVVEARGRTASATGPGAAGATS